MFDTLGLGLKEKDLNASAIRTAIALATASVTLGSITGCGSSPTNDGAGSSRTATSGLASDSKEVEQSPPGKPGTSSIGAKKSPSPSTSQDYKFIADYDGNYRYSWLVDGQSRDGKYSISRLVSVEDNPTFCNNNIFTDTTGYLPATHPKKATNFTKYNRAKSQASQTAISPFKDSLDETQSQKNNLAISRGVKTVIQDHTFVSCTGPEVYVKNGTGDITGVSAEVLASPKTLDKIQDPESFGDSLKESADKSTYAFQTVKVGGLYFYFRTLRDPKPGDGLPANHYADINRRTTTYARHMISIMSKRLVP